MKKYLLPIITVGLLVANVANAAIAFDSVATSTDTTTSPVTWSHTVAGSNTVLIVTIAVQAGSGGLPSITAPTYNGASMTLLGSVRAFNGGNAGLGMYYLLNPATGTHTVSSTVSSLGTIQAARGMSVSYTGVAQSGQPDATSGIGGTFGTNPSSTITTVLDNSWVVGAIADNGGTLTPLLTARAASTSTFQMNVQDTNGPITPAASQLVGWTDASNQYFAIQTASFAPFTSPLTQTPSLVSITAGNVSITGGNVSITGQ